jgi:hypothetical protein
LVLLFPDFYFLFYTHPVGKAPLSCTELLRVTVSASKLDPTGKEIALEMKQRVGCLKVCGDGAGDVAENPPPFITSPARLIVLGISKCSVIYT